MQERSSSLNSEGTGSTASSSRQTHEFPLQLPFLDSTDHQNNINNNNNNNNNTTNASEEVSVDSSVTSPYDGDDMDAVAPRHEQHYHNDDERLHDVTLLGRSGVQVRATRYVLACQNELLQERLYYSPPGTRTVPTTTTKSTPTSSPQQQQKPVLPSHVEIGQYGAVVLMALKEFCHTQSLSHTTLATNFCESSARHLVELTELAMAYQYGALFDATDRLLSEMLYRRPELVFCIYDKACLNERTTLLTQYALDFIQQRTPDLLLGSDGLRYLHCLEALVYDLAMPDRATFFLVSRWVQLNGRSQENMQRAQLLCGTLRMDQLIQTPEMCTLVARSGFIDLGVLETAIQKQRELSTSTGMSQEGKDNSLDDVVVVVHDRDGRQDSGMGLPMPGHLDGGMTTLEGTCFQFTPSGPLVCPVLAPNTMPVFQPLNAR